jgi:hypothetical protein
MRSVWLTLALLVVFAVNSNSEVNIDYIHNIKGTGTIMTDYQMGAETGTEASGRVRGTGDVMDKYLFSASNSSGNVTIEDEFVMSKSPQTNESLPIPAIYPQMPDPLDFRLTGAAWADRIELNTSGYGLGELGVTQSTDQIKTDFNGSRVT